MKGSMRAATAIGVGYLLGRRKKLRTATLMAAAAAVGGTTIGGAVLRRGMQKVGSADAVGGALGKVSPQLGDVAKTLRADLATASKAAATAAVNNRVDALADSIHQRAERVRNPSPTPDGKSAASVPRPRDTDDTGDRDAGDRYDDEYDAEDQYEDDRYEDDEDEDREPSDYADDDRADEEDEAPQDEDSGPARRRGTARRSPVTRARG